MLVLEGMPLLLLELGIGQKMRTGSFGVWNRVHPYLGGIGIGSTVVAVIVGCYYNAIIAWGIFYLFKSFNVSFCTEKPFAECIVPIAAHILQTLSSGLQVSKKSYNLMHAKLLESLKCFLFL